MTIRVIILILLGLVVGCISALAAVGLVEAVLWLNDQLLISSRSRFLANDPDLLIIATLGVPTLGGLLVGLICLGIPEKRPHGPADAIRAAQTMDPAMPVKGGVLSALAACVSLGAGASVGQYGPLAHMGASLGSWVSRFAGDSRYIGTIGIGCGVAAAISAAFNAPIAGLVFAHEVILRHYSLRAFAPITVAAIMGYVIANVVFEGSPLFRIDAVSVANPYEYIAFIGMGICGAVVAKLYMQAILFSGDTAQKISLPGPVKTACAGLLLGVVALEIPDVLGIGKEVLRFAIIDGAFTPGELALTLIAKLLVTALCIGFGFAGGVFSPALLIGILFGALVGSGAELVFQESHSPIAVYAICGMVAVTSPVIGAPLTAILIVFELTRNYDLATAAMVSVAFSNLIGYRIFGRSLFDMQLLNRGIDLSLGRDKVIVQQKPVGDLLSQDYTRVRTGSSLSEVRKTLIDEGRSEGYVVDDGGQYVGTVTVHRLMEIIDSGMSQEIPIEKYARKEILVLQASDSIWGAMRGMEDFIGESIPVIEADKLVGVVFEAAIVSTYLEILDDIRREENAAA